MSILLSQPNVTHRPHIMHSIREEGSTMGDHSSGAENEFINQVGASLHLSYQKILY